MAAETMPTGLRGVFESMVTRDVREISGERRPARTLRALEAQRELDRRRLEEAAERDRAVAQTALDCVSAWSLSLHARSWEEWANLVELALDFDSTTSARSLQVNIENNCGVTVSIPPRGASWTFWPPRDEEPPAECRDLAWQLARKCAVRGGDDA